MASKTIYTCDRCHKEVGNNDLARIDVELKSVRAGSGYRQYSRATTKDICTDCLKELGFVTGSTNELVSRDDVNKHNTATLEDKLVDLLIDLGVVFME